MNRPQLLAGSIAATLVPQAARPATIDRDLIAQARAEGALTFYGTISQPQMAALAKRFQAEMGIPVATLRGDASLVSRIVTEARAGHNNVDVIGLAGFDTYEVYSAGVLARYRPPEAADLLAETVDPNGYWTAAFVNTETIAYNTERLKSLGIGPPRTWEDFAAPPWRGRFGLFSSSFEWLGAMIRFYGRQRAEALARAYAANEPRLLTSHSLVVSQTTSGEVIGAANIYGYDVLAAQANGQPIALVNPNPTVIELFCASIAQAAPHPMAARLFVRWWLSRPTQLWFRDELKRLSARRDVQNDTRLLNPKVRYVFSNPADAVNAADVIHTFNAIFNVPG